jgi:hypothetical protein
MADAETAQTIVIHQLENLERPVFTIPPALIPRFEAIARPEETPDNPLSRFAGAVVFEAEMPGDSASDEELRARADELILADKVMREQPGIPFMMVNQHFLELGVTSPESTLYFSNGSAHVVNAEEDQMFMEMPVAMNTSAEIKETDVTLDDPETIGYGNRLTTDVMMQMPVHALTPENLDHAEEASADFLEAGSLVVGEPAIDEFLQKVRLQRPERELAKRQQAVVDKAADIMRFFHIT